MYAYFHVYGYMCAQTCGEPKLMRQGLSLNLKLAYSSWPGQPVYQQSTKLYFRQSAHLPSFIWVLENLLYPTPLHVKYFIH